MFSMRALRIRERVDLLVFHAPPYHVTVFPAALTMSFLAFLLLSSNKAHQIEQSYTTQAGVWLASPKIT